MWIQFWNKHPALFLGLSTLLGTACAVRFSWILVVIFTSLLLTRPRRFLCYGAMTLFLFSYLSFPLRHPPMMLPQEKVYGSGQFHITKVFSHSSPFQRALVYQGTLKHFQDKEGKVYPPFPCRIYLPPYGQHPPAHCDYVLEGHVIQKQPPLFLFKPKKQTQWRSLPHTYSIAHARYTAKKMVSHWIKKHIKTPTVQTLLSALATGEVEERLLTLQLGKLGVQHVLAISGFHFAIIALFLDLLLRSFCSRTLCSVCLCIAMTLLYIFLGDSPAIQRAYLAIALALIGRLFQAKISGLNAMGAALLFALLLHPLSIISLSFQLTFLCTAAILLLYTPFNHWLSRIFPQRTPQETASMGLLDKHGYLCARILRSALALNFSVHVFSGIVLLHLFHKFSLLSLVYNLFIPFFITLSMLLLCTAFLFAPFSQWIHTINETWTAFVIKIVSHPPAHLDYVIRSNQIGPDLTICIVAALFFFSIFLHEKTTT